ncbi:APC family permease [Streptomyces sp. NBC_00536]|uniref:APC family permease n=1 Tax=Streptomyces sp. NBC_00536 TaxID=2975769 RepID=UPI002E81A9B0|nr:APC family permease [Streptomyces sp. NBC_00536]WUC83832.1 APC family permease [Streptomyces sp. NBC_00536]
MTNQVSGTAGGERGGGPGGGPDGGLRRSLGVGDAVVVGLGAMVGAGIFAALAPAARAAGGALLAALAVAGVVAYCNAWSTARLAARHPSSGGTYVYGRECLGPFWGYLAGWGFVIGKTASCAAMALTVGAYLWPGREHVVAVVAVVALTAAGYGGVQKSARIARVIVAAVLAVLAGVVTVCLTSEASGGGTSWGGGSRGLRGLLEAAGLLFFAFAGYARIATLGEEVRDPERTIPRAVPLALGIALAVYAAVTVAVLSVLGADGLAGSTAPLSDAVRAAGWAGLTPVVRAGAVLAALGSLLALVLGVSRTTLAMARDGHLPRALASVHPRRGVPHRAELAVGAVVAVLAATVDLRGAIGFSSFGVLVYYAIANAAAWTLGGGSGAGRGAGTGGFRGRLVAAVGLAGCVVLACALPLASALAGAGVLALGALLYGVRHAVRRRPGPRAGSGPAA